MYIEMFLLQLLDDRTFSLREFSCGLIDHHPSPHAARPHPYGGAGPLPIHSQHPLLLTYLSPQARLLDPSGSLRVRWCCIERRHTVWEAILGGPCGRHCRLPTFVFSDLDGAARVPEEDLHHSPRMSVSSRRERLLPTLFLPSRTRRLCFHEVSSTDQKEFSGHFLFVSSSSRTSRRC